MTIFKFPKKTLTLTCVTGEQTALDWAPIKYASAFYPDWWKSLPKNSDETWYPAPTLKTCTGFVRHFENSVILPSWCEVSLNIGSYDNPGIVFQYSDSKSKAAVHGEEQRGSFLPDNRYQHLKLVSPWYFHCKEVVKFAFIAPQWNNESPEHMITLPGTVDFHYQHVTNINMMFPRSPEPKIINIPVNHPLAHIIPLSEKKLKLEVVYDPDKAKKLTDVSNTGPTFINKFLNRRAIIQKKSESKCPFGFGKK